MFVSWNRTPIFHQVVVGFIHLAGSDFDFRYQVVIVRVVAFADVVSVGQCSLEVILHQGLASLEDIGQRGVRVELQGVVNGLCGLVAIANEIVVVGYIDKVVNIHEREASAFCRSLVAVKQFTELFAIEVLLVNVHVLLLFFTLLPFPSVLQSNGFVEHQMVWC